MGYAKLIPSWYSGDLRKIELNKAAFNNLNPRCCKYFFICSFCFHMNFYQGWSTTMLMALLYGVVWGSKFLFVNCPEQFLFPAIKVLFPPINGEKSKPELWHLGLPLEPQLSIVSWSCCAMTARFGGKRGKNKIISHHHMWPLDAVFFQLVFPDSVPFLGNKVTTHQQ